MSSLSSDGLLDPQPEELAILLALRNSEGLVSLLPVNDQEKEYHLRLRSLQQCICDLLLGNQRLRMAMTELQAIRFGDKHGNHL